MTGDDLRAILREELQPVHERLEAMDRKLEDAAADRELMWGAIMRLAAPPGSSRTLAETKRRRRNGAAASAEK